MKHALAYGILVLVLAVLAGLLLVRSRDAEQRQKVDGATILTFSNNWKDVSLKLDEAHGVINNLEKDAGDLKTAIQGLTNDLQRTTNDLSQTRNDLEAARAAREKAQAEIAKQTARITELEAQNLNLEGRATELTNAIGRLNTQIAETQHKLAVAEGDKAFLEGELNRLMAEKADLEKKFNDLAVLKAQVKKLKEELAVSRRLQWIRSGLWANPDRKGAELLMQKPRPSPPPATNSDLNVEIGSDGSVRVISPQSKPSTNAPGR